MERVYTRRAWVRSIFTSMLFGMVLGISVFDRDNYLWTMPDIFDIVSLLAILVFTFAIAEMASRENPPTAYRGNSFILGKLYTLKKCNYDRYSRLRDKTYSNAYLILWVLISIFFGSVSMLSLLAT